MLDRGERPIMTSNPQPPDRGRFIEGFSAAAVFNVAALFIVGSFFTRAGVPVGAMGIVQLAWIIPLWNSYRKKREDRGCQRSGCCCRNHLRPYASRLDLVRNIMESTDSTHPTDRGSIARGFLTAAFVSVLVLLASSVMVPLALYVVTLVGIVQLLWLGPLWNSYRRKGNTESAKGVLLAAGITFLLNAACWGSIRTYGISG